MAGFYRGGGGFVNYNPARAVVFSLPALTPALTKTPSPIPMHAPASPPLKKSPVVSGLVFAVVAVAIFSLQDGMSKYLASRYDVAFVVMLRYWAFALFVLVYAAASPGGIRAMARSHNLPLQIGRGVLLGVQVIIIIWCFANLGLLATHVIIAVSPLMVVLLSVPILGEKVGLHRGAAVVAGFIGVLIILRPGSDSFSPLSLFALLPVVMFGGYNILTRLAARDDRPGTSFFWTGIGGAVAVTCIGLFYIDPMQTAQDWMWMGLTAITGAAGHYCMIRALDLAEASAVQPFYFLQTVFASLLGVLVFGEEIHLHMLAGAAVVMAAGLYAFRRERSKKSRGQGGGGGGK